MKASHQATKAKPRPITVTFTGDLARKIRKQAKELEMSSALAARNFARLGLTLCDTNDRGCELRDALHEQEPMIDGIMDMEPAVIANLYALAGRNGLV